MRAAGVDSQQLVLVGPAGEIEAAIDRVPEAVPKFVCVICHPHPLQQGTMNNKVVTTLSRTAARNGGLCLRFNYRGVGASQGTYDGERGEVEDALAVIRAARARSEAALLPLIVAGFSFGGAVAYRAALEIPTAALITVAPAHQRVPEQTTGRFANWLLIQGEDDEIIAADGVLQWARRHDPQPAIAGFEGTGHFFHGRLSQLSGSVSAYLQNLVL